MIFKKLTLLSIFSSIASSVSFAQVSLPDTTNTSSDVASHHEEVTKKEDALLDKELLKLAEKEKKEQSKYKDAPQTSALQTNSPVILSSPFSSNPSQGGPSVRKRKKKKAEFEEKTLVVVPPEAVPSKLKQKVEVLDERSKPKKSKKIEDDLPQ